MVGAVLMLGGLGLIVGIGLAVASKIFYVYVDPLILKIDDVLPGANCGGCGLPGCSANAEAIVAGKAAPNSCVAAGSDVAEAIAAIMGVAVEAKEPDIARPGCYFGVQDADLKYEYNGLNDCRAAAALSGGMKVCTIGCLGLGTCARACPFDAIVMGPDNLPVVDNELCTGCGTCEKVCPKNIINLSSITRRILREYTVEECTTPCQRACPAGINIREYIRQVSLGNPLTAVQVIKERNPFPTVIGRICPRPCENECRRNYSDEPVAINFLKRYAADYEMERGERVLPYKAPSNGKRVAVIGGGVEGLSTAFFSARLGYDVSLYEATEKLGGLLRSAIAANRLPSDILDWDIGGVLEMGVTAEVGKMLGKDITINGLLQEGHQAVFVATGGWDSRLSRGGNLQIEQTLPGTYLMVDVLRTPAEKAEPFSCGADVVIAGGGEMAVEAAMVARKAGATMVTILFREMEIESPINAEGLEALRSEGIQVRFTRGIGRFYGEESELKELETIDLLTNEREKIAAQTVILATGRFPEMIFLPDHGSDEIAEGEIPPESPEEQTAPAAPLRWQAIAPYKKPEDEEQKGLFAVGDVFSDFSAAIRAIGAGRRGAASMHELIYDIPLTFPEEVLTHRSIIQDVDHVEQVSKDRRQIMPLCSPAEQDQCREIEKGFSPEAAKTEADRCLQCGLICYQHSPQPAAEATTELQKTA